jgi:hypothetical protein
MRKFWFHSSHKQRTCFVRTVFYLQSNRIMLVGERRKANTEYLKARQTFPAPEVNHNWREFGWLAIPVHN